MNPIRIGKQLQRQVECAKQAGIYDAMCLAFGSVLAVCRHRGPNMDDDDDDVMIFADMVTAEQEREYVRLLEVPTADFPDKGIGRCRFMQETRPDNGRYFWASIKGDASDVGRKCCHWFVWRQGGYLWHCKSKGAMVKGIPENLCMPGVETEYFGAKIRLPSDPGACLDWWYPGNWLVPRNGVNSAPTVTMKIGDWTNKATWKISG
jgi:hypothetical protein